MAKVRPTDVLFWMLAMLALASVVLFMLVLSGAVAIDSSPTASQTTETTKTTSAAAASPAKTTTRTKPAAAPTTATKTATQAPAPAQKPAQLTTVVLTASRGDCWFQARAGSAEGKVLDERVLSQGESTSIKSKSVWLTVGASGNLDVTVNGKPEALAAGTVSVVLGANGTAN
jgi:hypothetical protein